jgi:ferredoxin
MTDRIPVIREEDCLACGACEEICPEVFRLNQSLGFAMVINPGGADEAKIQEAMDACPTRCLDWSGGPE